MAGIALHQLLPGAWRREPGRWLLSIGVIALGVALVTAIHTLNHSALTELDQAARQLGGDADLRIEAGRAGFSDEVFKSVVLTPGVQAASPVLEFEVEVVETPDELVKQSGSGGIASRASRSLRIIGMDVLRAARVQPGLVPRAMLGEEENRLAALDPQNVFLNEAALRRLGLNLQAGGALPELRLRLPGASGPAEVFRVAGTLGDSASNAALAAMDIAAAQHRFGLGERLTRIDIRRAPEMDEVLLAENLTRILPAETRLTTPEQGQARTAALSRGYRANLTVLALVALFTGGFMVFSVTALSVVRRRSELALLQVLGVTRKEVLRGLLREGLLAGAWGSALGIAAGLLLARGILALMAGDLGAGFFAGVAPVFHIDVPALLVIALTGLGAGTLGVWLPALEACSRPAARALKEGDEAVLMQAAPAPWIGCVLLGLALPLLLMPPVRGVPLGGYIAIALALFGTLALLPALLQALARKLRSPQALLPQLAWQQFAGMPGYAVSGLATVVVSFSLVAAMAIMVHSFRNSVDHWLGHVLAADVYLRAPGGLQAKLPEGLADRLCRQTQLARCERLRYHSLLLDPQQPPVTLIARTIDEHTLRALELAAPPPRNTANPVPRIWVSEAMVALHGAPRQGRYELPLGTARIPVEVVGVWRDYSRTWGALVMDRSEYSQLTGDTAVNDLAFTLAPGASVSEFARMLRSDAEAGRQEIAERSEIRRLSLALFDRTFAVTYALELAALLVGLTGIAAHFAALTVTRRREFGMLRHLGFTRAQLGRMLMLEGAVTGGAGALVGLVLGFGISLVLIHVVNRQSFHWGMELSLPWLPLLALTLLLIALAALGARQAGRAAMSREAVFAVKGDS